MSTDTTRRQDPGVRHPRRNALLGAIGAVVEWYDLMLYGYLATVFSRVFFPPSDGLVSLIGTYGAFAVGYFARPVGGIFFGRLGDRMGRKVSLTVAVSLMAVPMLVTAMLPTYATWGVTATLLLVLMRLLQGFSVGGEFSGTLVFLLEGSRRGGRGLLASTATAFSGVGVLLASVVVLVLTLTLTTGQLDAWGWRIPYLIGASIAVLGLFMRLRMEETSYFQQLREEGAIAEHPVREAMRKHFKPILVCAALTGYLGIAYYIVATFLVGFLQSIVGIPHSSAMVVTTAVAAVYAFTAPVWGRLSDRWGRRPPMMWSAVALALLAYPAFLMMATGNLVLIYVGEFALLLPVMVFTGAFSPAVSELFPTRDRNSGMGVGYNFGNAALGATAPTVATALVHFTGVEQIPSAYLIVASGLIVLVILRMRETAFESLSEK